MGLCRPKRRFTLLDALILLASTAVGLAVLARDAETDFEGNLLARVGEGTDDRPYIPVSPEIVGWDLENVVTHGPKFFMLMPPVLTTWSVTLLGLRFVPPRPRRKRMAVEPGMLACLAGAMAVMIVLIWKVGWWLTDALCAEGWEDAWIVLRLRQAPIGAVRLVAFSVVLTWTALAWGGLWGRSRDWIERSGRVLGGLWILSGLGDCASEFLEWFGPYFFRGGFR